MLDFFDKAFFQQLVVGILLLLLSIFLGSKTIKSHPATDSHIDKDWKIAMIISWIMVFSGIYVFSVNFEKSGFYHPNTGLGLSLFCIGIMAIFITKIYRWWKYR